MPDIYSPDGMRAAPVALAPVLSQLTQTVINQSGAGTIVLAPAIAGQKNRLYKLVLTVSAATATLQFQDQGEGGAAINLTGVITMAVGVPLMLSFDGQPWFQTAAGLAPPSSPQNALNLVVGGAGQVSGTAYYTQGP